MTDPLLLVREIADLTARGKTWAEVAQKMGYRDAKAAKKIAKRAAGLANSMAAVRRGRSVAVAERLMREAGTDA